MMRIIIGVYLLLLAPPLLIAQQYVHIKTNAKSVDKPGLTIPVGAKLVLWKEEDDKGWVIYFGDTVSVKSEQYDPVSFPYNVLPADSFFTLDEKTADIIVNISPLRRKGITGKVYVFDPAGKQLNVFVTDTVLRFKTGKLRLVGESFPDLFYTGAKLPDKKALENPGGKPEDPPPHDPPPPGIPEQDKLNWVWITAIIVALVAGALVWIIMGKKNKHKKQQQQQTQPAAKTPQEDILAGNGDNKNGGNNTAPNSPGPIEEWLKRIEGKLDQALGKGREDDTLLAGLKAKLEQKETTVKEQDTELNRQKEQLAALGKQNDFYKPLLLQAPELKIVAGQLYNFIAFLQSVQEKAAAFYDELLVLSPQGVNTHWTAQLMAKYNLALPQAAIGKWQQLCLVIRDTGCITDPQLIRSFSKQELTAGEKTELFRKTIGRELLRPWVNACLLLCEELKNLRHFTRSGDDTSIRSMKIFGDLVKDLQNNARHDADLHIQYLPLLDYYLNYNHVKVVTDPAGPLYANINGQERDRIIEIKEYGISVGQNEEPQKTLVVIQK